MPRIATAQELFDHLPRYFAPENAEGISATFQFDLSGEGGGEWTVTIAGGKISATPGRVETPTLTVQTAAADWIAIINRELHPMAAYMQGRIQVSGDLRLAMKMQNLFRRPD